MAKTLTVSLGPSDRPLPAHQARAEIDGVCPDNISGIWLSLDAEHSQMAELLIKRTLHMDGQLWTSGQTGLIKSMSLTIEYEEAQ